MHRLFFLLLHTQAKIANIFYKTFYKTAPILLYHRISTTSADPLMLCVTPVCFENHLQFLKKHYNIIPLSELSGLLIAGTLKGNEAAVTFDDGYRDNIINALPLLEKYNIPATIFITTGALGRKASFEWDMKYKESDRAVFLSETEIKSLYEHPLIEIGAHTETHQRLASATPEEQKKEILKSKLTLEYIIGEKVRSFAYPFGGIYDFNNFSKEIVEQAGFDFAYSNTQKLAKKTKNSLGIPRINIRECTVFDLSKKIICRNGTF